MSTINSGGAGGKDDGSSAEGELNGEMSEEIREGGLRSAEIGNEEESFQGIYSEHAIDDTPPQPATSSGFPTSNQQSHHILASDDDDESPVQTMRYEQDDGGVGDYESDQDKVEEEGVEGGVGEGGELVLDQRI